MDSELGQLRFDVTGIDLSVEGIGQAKAAEAFQSASAGDINIVFPLCAVLLFSACALCLDLFYLSTRNLLGS